jgi:hypothetical protein
MSKFQNYSTRRSADINLIRGKVLTLSGCN